MKLNLEQIEKITIGTIRIVEENSYIRFYRFSEEEEKVQKDRLGLRQFSSAGVKLLFKTDSRTLKLSVLAVKSAIRTYFSFDVFVNGKAIGYIDNFMGNMQNEDYTEKEYPLGEFSKKFDLGEGTKHVCIHFPWSVIGMLKDMELDDNAKVEPIEVKYKALVYGDSIAWGADTLRPSARYASRLCNMLEAEELNKIGNCETSSAILN